MTDMLDLSAHAVNAKRKILRYVEGAKSFPSSIAIEPGIRGAMIGILNEACAGNDARRAVLSWLFSDEGADVAHGLASQKSTHDLTDFQWWALHQWICPVKTDEGPWISDGEFNTEIVAVLSVVLGTPLSPLEVAIDLGGVINEIIADSSDDSSALAKIAEMKRKHPHLFS